MRKSRGRLEVIDDAPALPVKRTDTSGSASKSYYWGHLAAVRREWLHQFGRLRKRASDLTLIEIRNIEARVRKELYP